MPGAINRSGGGRPAESGLDAFPYHGPPEPHGDMSDAERKVWAMLLHEIPEEVLRKLDAFLLSTLCECIVTCRQLQARIRRDPTDSKITSTYLKYAAMVDKLSAKFGLSPVDRRRMRLEPPEEPDDADAWMES